MSMTEWAKREVEIAVARERKEDGSKEGEFSYGGACYESALKAFESLCEDGHSGFSIGLTKHILNRLIDGKPLTAIQDTEDEWNDISHYDSLNRTYKTYQCKRMSSLFKNVYENGRVTYNDIGRYYCKNVKSGATYTYGLMRDILDEMFPIKMPYFPEDRPFIFTCEDLKLNDTSGDFDTIVIHTLKTPDGRELLIGRYFSENETGEMVEISEREYLRKKLKEVLE